MTLDRHSTFVFTLTLALAVAVLALSAAAQAFSVLHYFTGGSDGANPYAGVTVGGSGALYGTTSGGGVHVGMQGYGIVFKLAERNMNWTLSPLYEFTGGVDGANPLAGVVDLNGVLYGTTLNGGSEQLGTVYELRPPPTACKAVLCYWGETVLHSFAGSPDGSGPGYGNVSFDQVGNIYGTTIDGGNSLSPGCGIIWELTRSGGGWSENILFNFISGSDGCNPYSGVIFDSAGNLYGNTLLSGDGTGGTVYQLTHLEGNWVENILADGSQGTGSYPYGTLIMDQSGSLYGTASDYFSGRGGTVFKISRSGVGWIASPVYAFSSCQPAAGVTLGADGNLYGVCFVGGANNYGWVFEMPPNCNGTCTPTDLHDFDNSDGANPVGPVVFDANGNLYGTTFNGGSAGTNCPQYGCGVVWEITP